MRDVVRLAQVRAMLQSGKAKTIRETARLSLTEVADAVGVAVSTLWRWENNERLPKGEAAIRYFDVLDELVDGLMRLGRFT